MKPLGFNPMRWNCQRDGCFNVKRRPKIEVFADCFPRKINFGDVDGMIELSGSFLLLEWKGEGAPVHGAQMRAYRAFTTGNRNLVVIVEGDAETMVVTRYRRVWNGTEREWKEGTIEDVMEKFRGWVAWVSQPLNGE